VIAAGVLVTMFLAAEPVQEGDRVVEDVTEAARFERRRRLLGGGFSLSTGAVRVAAGGMLIYASNDASSGLARAGRLHVIAGSATFVMGVTSMALPGPLARLTRRQSFALLRQDPNSAFALAAFEAEWRDAARRARNFRLFNGALSIGVGATLTTIASINTFARDRSPDHTVLDASMLATGAGFLGAGITGVILESEVERSYKRHASRRITVAPALGGVTFSGRF
jgi:hypothetical protein